jgi:hypothetical protein
MDEAYHAGHRADEGMRVTLAKLTGRVVVKRLAHGEHAVGAR